MSKLGLGLAVTALLAFGCGGDDDDDGGGGGGTVDAAGGGTTFNVPLTAAEEVPVCTSAGASAAGNATITISADSSTITVMLTFTGLSGTATAAHIHAGAAGVSGGVALPLGTNPVSPVTATLTAAEYQAPNASLPDFASFVAAMQADMTYINVHTAACMPGEIRGQIN